MSRTIYGDVRWTSVVRAWSRTPTERYVRRVSRGAGVETARLRSSSPDLERATADEILWRGQK
jgi:hypothetical protein